MSLRKAAYRGWTRLRRRLTGIPAPGGVNFGDLRRTAPLGRDFGADRGQPIDRHYIEHFLARHANDVRGQVLEVGESTYTRRYGGNRVTHSDVLHVRAGNPLATIVADLAAAPQIPDATFDCAIVTQTLQMIYDAPAAVRTLHRILKPGGVLLMTVPGLTPVPRQSDWGYTWYWSFTPLAVDRMLHDTFGSSQVTSEASGNVLVATAFLHGLALDELQPDELAEADMDYPVIIAARAVRAA